MNVLSLSLSVVAICVNIMIMFAYACDVYLDRVAVDVNSKRKSSRTTRLFSSSFATHRNSRTTSGRTGDGGCRLRLSHSQRNPYRGRCESWEVRVMSYSLSFAIHFAVVKCLIPQNWCVCVCVCGPNHGLLWPHVCLIVCGHHRNAKVAYGCGQDGTRGYGQWKFHP